MAIGKQLEIEGLHRALEGFYSQCETEGVSGDFEESKECIFKKGNGIAKMSAIESFEAHQETNQLERVYHDFQLKDTRKFPGENPTLNETVISSEIVALKDSSRASKCNQCDYQTSKGSHLRQHQQNVHEGMKYSCTSCDYKSGKKSNLQRHIEKDHLGVSYTCKVCEHVCSTKGVLKRHVDIQHNGLRYKCLECDGVFGEKGSLKRHVRIVHKSVKI